MKITKQKTVGMPLQKAMSAITAVIKDKQKVS